MTIDKKKPSNSCVVLFENASSLVSIMMLTFVALLTFAGQSFAATDSPADIVYTNGKIYTVNIKKPWAEAIAINNGKFIAVGSSNDVKASHGAKIDRVDKEKLFYMSSK